MPRCNWDTSVICVDGCRYLGSEKAHSQHAKPTELGDVLFEPLNYQFFLGEALHQSYIRISRNQGERQLDSLVVSWLKFCDRETLSNRPSIQPRNQPFFPPLSPLEKRFLQLRSAGRGGPWWPLESLSRCIQGTLKLARRTRSQWGCVAVWRTVNVSTDKNRIE